MDAHGSGASPIPTSGLRFTDADCGNSSYRAHHCRTRSNNNISRCSHGRLDNFINNDDHTTRVGI